jgi:hypothetical protein
LARQRIFHIDKEAFLPAFKDAFLDVFTEENCRKAFQASGLVPMNAQVVLDRFEVRLRTPPEAPLTETSWQSKTPSNTHEFGVQSKFVSDSFVRSPVTAQNGFSQLVKGGEVMLYQNVLLSSRVSELEKQVESLTKRKARKRKRIQHGGTMEYGIASSQVAAKASIVSQRSKRRRSQERNESGQPASRRCTTCGGAGHNARTCTIEVEDTSTSDSSTKYIGSLFDSDESDDL